MGELFYTGQLGVDAAIIALFILLSGVAFVVARVPRFFPSIYEALVSGREQEFYSYLARYISPVLFRALSYLQSIFGLTLAALLFMIRVQHTEWANEPKDLLPFLLLFALILCFFTLHRLGYRLISWVFVPRAERIHWRWRYTLLEWLWGISSILTACVFLIPETGIVGLVCLICFFLLWRTLLFIKSIPCLRTAEIGWFHLFMYLCAHEILPFLCFGAAVAL